MPKPKISQVERIENAAAERRVHAAILGYQPFRMKPVHFATSFLLALTGRYYPLELLNKASVPKAAPKSSRGHIDEYVTVALYPRLLEADRLTTNVSMDEFRLLRSHLNAAYNNDGAALNPAFAPYDTFGTDYSAPSLRYISNKSKNHGYSGSFVVRVLQATAVGRHVLEGCQRLLRLPPPPLSLLGAPLTDQIDEEWDDRYNALFGIISSDVHEAAAEDMELQTMALQRLVINLEELRSPYAIRYLIIGLCSWLFVYMMRRGNQSPLLLMDCQQGKNPRIRTQSRATYARQLDIFSNSYDRWWGLNQDGKIDPDDWAVFDASVSARQILDDHFRDLGVRIGFVQPRAPTAKRKHIELQADTLRVLALSLIAPGQVLTLPEFSQSLRKHWCICAGAHPDDARLLREARFGPLDADEDLQPNANEFRALLVRLGLAVEPSDGLTLCALNAEELI